MSYQQDKEAREAFRRSESVADIAFINQFVVFPIMVLASIGCFFGWALSKFHFFGFSLAGARDLIIFGAALLIGAVIVWRSAERDLRSIPEEHFRRIFGTSYSELGSPVETATHTVGGSYGN